ncbi:hypothetical protein BKA62DRAFT_755971 [Auriculariales sp. MPI-PUGE-AT-0066]|nr:hypothetical protein BKA62DRAFT_755971 [Auriculariales sp. MPI-PUGE-AT-0066]
MGLSWSVALSLCGVLEPFLGTIHLIRERLIGDGGFPPAGQLAKGTTTRAEARQGCGTGVMANKIKELVQVRASIPETLKVNNPATTNRRAPTNEDGDYPLLLNSQANLPRYPSVVCAQDSRLQFTSSKRGQVYLLILPLFRSACAISNREEVKDFSGYGCPSGARDKSQGERRSPQLTGPKNLPQL